MSRETLTHSLNCITLGQAFKCQHLNCRRERLSDMEQNDSENDWLGLTEGGRRIEVIIWLVVRLMADVSAHSAQQQ